MGKECSGDGPRVASQRHVKNRKDPGYSGKATRSRPSCLGESQRGVTHGQHSAGPALAEAEELMETFSVAYTTSSDEEKITSKQPWGD